LIYLFLFYLDSFREYDSLDLRSSLSKLSSTTPSTDEEAEAFNSRWIYHIANVILQSSEYLISYPSRSLTHNSGIYNSSSTNRIDLLVVTICEEDPCEHDENAFIAAEAAMKAFTVPNGIAASGRNNGLELTISQVKFSITAHPSLLVAWMQAVSYPKLDLPESIRFNQPNLYRNTVEKRIHSNTFLRSLTESRLFVDTIVKHLSIDPNSESTRLLPVISILTSPSTNLFSSEVSGDKGTVAIDSDRFHWDNVIAIRNFQWRYKDNTIIYDSESGNDGSAKNEDFAKNTNNLPDTAVILAYPKSSDHINGHCNSSIMCDGRAIPFSSRLLPEFLFYAIKSAIIGEDSILSHYSKINRRFTIDTTWYTPAYFQSKPAIKPSHDLMNYQFASTFREKRSMQRYIIFSHIDLIFSKFLSNLHKIVEYDNRINFNELFKIAGDDKVALNSNKLSKDAAGNRKANSENNVFDILNLQKSSVSMPDRKRSLANGNIYERFVSLIREASSEYSYIEYGEVMSTLKSMDGVIDELESTINKFMTRSGSIVCEIE
jgi:hypothetical protein